ncbi:hypothetical protein [Paenibacillus xylanexedens]|uniref:hypothetical protein n=1 Tax=Paenibacillus xylanexedens TaxID=528191 RepID=UPI0011A99F6B|nr:hypothetical protein [Paenibacillus xylanexedens]
MKLIDADKLLEWLAEKSSHLGNDHRMTAFEEVQESIENGMFAPDDIFKINVGDRVRHAGHKCSGTVVTISKNGQNAYVEWDRLIFTGSVKVSDLKLEGRESIPKEDTDEIHI